MNAIWELVFKALDVSQFSKKMPARIGSPQKGWTAPWSTASAYTSLETADKYMAAANLFWIHVQDVLPQHPGVSLRSIFGTYNYNFGMGPCDVPMLSCTVDSAVEFEENIQPLIHFGCEAIRRPCALWGVHWQLLSKRASLMSGVIFFWKCQSWCMCQLGRASTL